ncbi:MAG: DUF3326 domain-containing protein [Pseudonocardiales bacterium]|nr:DUF3326 domain-containing protein [Pseudonocardiales bacterium]
MAELIAPYCRPDEVPLRLVLVKHFQGRLTFELSVLQGADLGAQKWGPLWQFVPRRRERTERFVALHVVPTGIRAEIGGFAGDATPATNLLASTCDYLVTHPNAVTASDLYWARDNVLYLEGNLLSRFLIGQIDLLPKQTRRLGVLVDKPHSQDLLNNVINAVHACRTVGGLAIDPVWVSKKSLRGRTFYSDSGRALGDVAGLDAVFDIVREAERCVDALAITSEIDVSQELRNDYYSGKPVANPWGGVEALLTHAVTTMSSLPVAHAPMLTAWENTRVEGTIDPRDGAEVISMTYFCSVLRGLSAAPQPLLANGPTVPGSARLTLEDVGAIVLPASAVGGIPTFAGLAQQIPLILVTENSTLSPLCLDDIVESRAPHQPEVYLVSNYLEAAGVLISLKERLNPDAVRRPIAHSQPRWV